MKIDRLLAIVMLLLKHRRMPARQLADRFEVSLRTIYRDIDTLSQAGVPVVTYQGMNGGIGLVEGYRLDHTLLTDQDLAAITTAIRGLSTSMPNQEQMLLLDKITQIIPPSKTEQFRIQTEQLVVDLSDWGGHRELPEMLGQIRATIADSHMLHFSYRNADGQSTMRTLEPHTLVLKKNQWYVYGYCHLRCEFRLFKLSRMKDVRQGPDTFIRRPLAVEELPWQQDWGKPEQQVDIVLRFHPNGVHLAEEWFPLEQQQQDAAGYTRVYVSMPENDWLYSFILSIGAVAEVLEPPAIRQRVHEMVLDMQKKYSLPPVT
ncbi:helix-turn-helix transcriptional regulator [Paenibacillus massiliensis]|uniref:helix-turn-helix transcriptional regulator n=1 Tax=Paenibacillus massiliensis TaxID=225917 RepID=UPI00040AB435|nr:YafY family protein [Paenibacillus massiliensis]